jgi:PQQ-dependent catabolism-associated CXXCW motif protein
VLPRPPKPANLPEGTIWREQLRPSIPGATWLPNVGYGAIADATEAYFKAGLDKATGGDRAAPLVIFCLADCWMSWNAARRAMEYGYTNVHWLPEGTDGWAAAGYPLEIVEPEPGY